MTDAPVRILLHANLPPDFRRQVLALSPRIVLIDKTEEEQCPEVLADAEVIYGGIGREQWAQATSLKWIQTTWAGVEGMLTPEAKAHPAIITNARIHAVPIAEHLFGMLLMLTRGLNIAYRQQEQACWDGRLPGAQVVTLPGKTLGVLGLGAIGRRVAEIGAAFGMRVIGLRRHPGDVPYVAQVYTHKQQHEMLAQCDFIMNTLPLTPETIHFLGEAEFAAMRIGVLLFNIGRGKTIDTAALVRALQAGKVGGAGLDVTDPEPLPPDHSLWQMPNVIISPHYAGLHPEYAEKSAHLFLENLRRYLRGETLLNVVDKAAGY